MVVVLVVLVAGLGGRDSTEVADVGWLTALTAVLLSSWSLRNVGVTDFRAALIGLVTSM
jgi:hypothetical protein